MPANQSVKGALRWMIFGKGATQIVNWLVTIIVIRLLTPADYGLLAMAMVIIAAGQMIREVGLQQALVQSEKLSELQIRQVFTVLFFINILLFSALYLSAPLAAAHFDEPPLVKIIRVLSLQFPLLALQSVPLAMLAREMNFKKVALIGVISAAVNSAVTLALAILGYGVWSLVIGNVSATFIRICLLAFSGRIFYTPTLNFSGFRKLFSFGGFVMLSSLLNYVQNKSAHWLIGGSLGKDALGIYSVSTRLATLPMQKVAGVLNQVGFAAFSKLQNDMPKVRENYLKTQAIIAFFAFPIFWGIAGVAESLVPTLIGEKWISATLALKYIALSVPMKMMFNLTIPALQGIGNSRLVFTNLLITSLTMPIAYYYALDWGVNGVASVWIICYPLLFIIMMFRSLTALGIPFIDYFQAIYRPLLISASMLFLVEFSHLQALKLQMGNLLELSCLVFIGATSYIITSLLFNRKMFRNSWKLIF